MALLDRLKRPTATAEPAPPAKPKGESGRFHTDGFIQVDEVNQALVGERGLKVFDEMFKTDADCRRMVMMIVVALAAGTWEVEPYGNDQDKATAEDEEVAEFVRWNLFERMSPSLIAHVWELLRVTLRSGFSHFEQIYAPDEWNGRTVLALDALDLRLPRTITRWIQDGHRLVTVEQQQIKGGTVPLPMRDLVYYRLGAEGDNWEGESLLRPAYKHWKYKSAIELVQAIGIEKSAIGVPTGYPPTSASPADLDAFEEFLANIRANETSYFLAPGPCAAHAGPNGNEGWYWEFVTPSGVEGGKRDIEAALQYHTGKIDAVILAEFMRLGQQGEGARATADVQQNPFLSLCEGFVGLLVEAPLNTQLVPRLVALNYSTDRMPRVKCSLIDSTSLTELGEYVSKLAAAGALRPEPTLEAHLRAKADFPEADEAAIKEKEQKVVEAQQQMAEHAASLIPEKSAPGDKPPAGGKPSQLASGHMDATNQPQTCIHTLSRQDRELRSWEKTMSLDRIEQTIEDSQARLEAAAGEQTRALAVALARGQKATTTDLEDAIEGQLEALFVTGRATVVEEIQRQKLGDLSWMLDTGPDEVPPAEQKTLRDRAKAIAQTIRAQVVAAVASVSIQRGASDATVQASAEAAAMAALRGQAQVHASSVLNAGRTVQADSQASEIVGSRYTSILDGRRCSACARADDDVLRPLDDPVRLDRIPPNPSCEGGGRCRCLEAFVYRDEMAGDA